MAAAPPFLRRRLLVFLAFQAVNICGAQNTTGKATTDPSEASGLNRMFERWGISATDQWNISGELCSGAATDGSDVSNMNPGIKCDCSYNDNSTCHITHLRVYALNVTGPLPHELWNLTHLVNLDLRQNYLTGQLPASIGNLTRMQYLAFGINSLSGEIPRELGLLTDLRSLSFGTNNFSGPLPSELGSLSRLTQIYFISAGVRGPIPQTFANLSSLERVWGSDNEITGQIPDFIGNWSNLVQLRLQGNSFEGPIPASFSNLTLLNDLRISDLSGGSTSLNFLRNMKSLSTLVLRNNNISGPIPSYLGEFSSLKLVDLSFNNLAGTIPDSLFNHTSLTYIFLQSNKLTGGLPSQKSPLLRNIDLSYNELSGSFPSWVNEQNLQLNLVSNNFTIEGSNTRALPSGLECIQRNFPCNRGAPRYSRFAVNCGGPQIRSNEGTVYESDAEPLGPATYYVTTTRRWAVSNAGLAIDNIAPEYRSVSSSPLQFTNTLDPELFQSVRISAGSLRFYGLGLENGEYNVTLQFAEITNPGARTWQNLQRRVFDIYIQGELEERDFNLQRESGRVSLRAVSREFTAQVNQNYLEIHLFWAGKGTCCVPRQAIYGPLISAISATPNFIPTVSDKPPKSKKNRAGLIAGVVVPVTATTLLALYYIYQRRNRQNNIEHNEFEFVGMDVRPYTFTYAELKAATDDFNPCNKLGEGGFGPVYKGRVGDGREVAVKQLSVASNQGSSQFLSEIATMSTVQHRNVVKLYGCCIEGDERMLVYEYLENKSLDLLLFGPGRRNPSLEWKIRSDICLGVARGLAYLHEESPLRIVHRDVKASNILLDSHLVPKISDFGLAKLYDDRMTHMSTRIAGTIGYLAPEYAMLGHLTEKADVFSFGVVASEIVSGRSNSDSSLEDDQIYLLEWVWDLHEHGKEMEVVDSTLQEYDADEARRIIGVALLCTQASPASRPPMSRVVAMLSGDIEVASVTTRPGYLNDWNYNDVNSFASNFVSSTSGTDVHAGLSITTTADSSYHPETPMLGEAG